MEEYKCKRCDKNFENYDGLRRHSGRIHKIESGKFYCEFYLKGNWPLCKCGCGERVKWNKNKFRDYAKAGHLSRIKNNWGHNQSAIDKSSETRRKQFASGERTTWCNGLTKDMSESLRKMAENISKSYSINRKKKSSNLMSKNRRNGVIPTLYGPQSSQWKGGTSEINNIARNITRLYEEWKYPILIRDEFKCKDCGSSKKLHVHHDKEKFCEIVEKHIPDQVLITDFDLKKSIAEKIVDYHIKNKVSGITLCGKCHEKYHPSLNFS